MSVRIALISVVSQKRISIYPTMSVGRFTLVIIKIQSELSAATRESTAFLTLVHKKVLFARITKIRGIIVKISAFQRLESTFARMW